MSSPRLTTVPPGRYCSTRSFGSPTFGCTMPVAFVPLIRAETPTSLSVIRSTTAPSGAARATLPTSPSSLITGSFFRTPEEVPLSIQIVEYQRFGDLPTAVAVTGR